MPKPRRTTHKRAYRLITDWIEAPKMENGLLGCKGQTGAVTRTLVPRGQWVVKEADGCWGVIDNCSGILEVEEFQTYEEAEKWLEKRHVNHLKRLRRKKK